MALLMTGLFWRLFAPASESPASFAVGPSIVTVAVIAGSADIRAICWSGETLKLMAQIALQTPELASRMACRSEPLPLSADVVTVSAFEPVTLTVADAVSFAEFGSPSPALFVTVLIHVPPCVAVATIVIVTVAPFGIAPMLQLTFVPVVQVPCVETADVAVCPGGSGSLTTTPLAGEGPLLVTVTV